MHKKAVTRAIANLTELEARALYDALAQYVDNHETVEEDAPLCDAAKSLLDRIDEGLASFAGEA